ncbi:ribosomal protein S18-alanine N-acetyltransferase [Enterococcus sp. 669A]|uniref:Ribosomal protein S18-alanine N-acetyltransferase n=1 Tax=Candidatus Enterococcus moelleringii TaxID=2815325 RepID=A0ABS3LAC6_9ENTE|nr:ribosomal protein S18-alanine N-acetyltransferase [Enterococcus sp. 669A]MBO1306576.1 ribosomal protein S18-alanine N-acetyltransferase [Enterococcus sp. 669A]
MLKKFSGLLRTFFGGKQEPFEARSVLIKEQEYLLRGITDDDIKELIALEKDVYQGEVPWTRSAFLAEIHSPVPHLYICMTHREELVAFIGSRIMGNDAHITNVAVKRAFQGSGLGSFLIDEVERFAIMKSCITLSLEVRMGNINAQRLYRRIGFEGRKVRRNYYTENNEDALEMIKHLEGPK